MPVLEAVFKSQAVEIDYTIIKGEPPYRTGHPDRWDDGIPDDVDMTVYMGGFVYEPEDHEVPALERLCIKHAEGSDRGMEFLSNHRAFLDGIRAGM